MKVGAEKNDLNRCREVGSPTDLIQEHTDKLSLDWEYLNKFCMNACKEVALKVFQVDEWFTKNGFQDRLKSKDIDE